MEIKLYKSALCPRCHMAARYLGEIKKENTGITVTEIDILSNPLQTWQDGVRLIPALKIGDRYLSGVYLTRQRIETFISESKK